MPKLAKLLVAALLALPFPAQATPSRDRVVGASAAPPCDFKGLSVGDTKTPAEIMNTLGVKTYKLNPPDESKTLWSEPNELEQHGMSYLLEKHELSRGPECSTTASINYCRVPFGYGVGIGNSNEPVSVFVSFKNKLVTEIDVSFDNTLWDEYLPMFHKKYGTRWAVDRNPNFQVLMDRKTQEKIPIELIALTNKFLGENPANKKQCEITLTNVNSIFARYSPPIQGSLVIKLISTNL